MKKLSQFLFFLAAFLSVKLNGQIIYTDIDPDSTVSASDSEVIKSYFIDLDNNGTYEFELRHFNPGGGHESVELHQNLHTNGNQKVLILSNGHSKVLSESDTVGYYSPQWGLDQYGILNTPWYGPGDKYLGFRFKISGNWHYGWARVNMPSDRFSFTIKDYAYNSVPGQSIIAGQATSGTEETKYTSVSVYPNPFCTLTVFQFRSPLNNAELRIFDLNGQKIRIIKNISGYAMTFERNGLPAGLYAFQLAKGNELLAVGKLVITD